MSASIENVKESGRSVERRVERRVGRRVGRRLSCRRLKDAQNRLFTGFFVNTAAGKPPPHRLPRIRRQESRRPIGCPIGCCEYGGKKAAAP